MQNRSAFLAAFVLLWLGCGLVVAAGPLPSLDELLREYQALGLPMPPREAKLVRYEARGGGSVNGKVQPIIYSLAFTITPGTKTEAPLLLQGTFELQPSWDPHIREVEPEPAALKDVVLDRDEKLVLAVQCHARGWDRLGRYLLESSQEKTEPPPRKQLLHLAWYYWEAHLTRPNIDRAPVAKRLKELVGNDKELDTERNGALLRSLELALVPSKAQPGSIEALIDGLVDYDADTGEIGFFRRQDSYWRIAELGFDAVPALIKHLDDDRLTRAMMIGFNNFPSWHLRVRDVAGDLLEGLAAEKLPREDNGKQIEGGWLRRLQGYPVSMAGASRWWQKARKTGEEPYLLEHVLPAADKDKGRGEPSDHLLYVIVAKYPRDIPALYRKVLDQRPDLDSRMLAEALPECDVPGKEKLDLLLDATKHKDSKHRLPAFYALREVDQKQFDSVLLAAIERLPQDVAGFYRGCPEAAIAGLAMESDDPAVWQALAKATKRSSVGLRTEMLSQFGSPEDRRHWPQRLHLLADYLNDSSQRYQEPRGWFDGRYWNLPVQDSVALELAGMLGIEIELKPDRTPEEWAKIRAEVQAQFRKEFAKPG